jgi:hypothetical protein
MSESDFNISLKGNVDALYVSLGRRKEFYITVQNLTESYMPQVKVRLSLPPQVRLLVKSEWYKLERVKRLQKLYHYFPNQLLINLFLK